MEYASVDLPEPFGPMIAWVSPDFTVRSTPRRISFGPASVSTETCRSRISSVLTGLVLLVVQRVFDVDQHVVAIDLDGVDGYGLGGRQAGRLPAAQVEARAVQPALDLAVLDVALGQRHLGVRAHVVDRVHLAAVAVHDRDRHALDLDADGSA